jgi:signal transduction histidine kinase
MLAVICFLFIIRAAATAQQKSYGDSIMKQLNMIISTGGKDTLNYRQAIDIIGRNKKEVLIDNTSIIAALDQLKKILGEKKYYNLYLAFYYNQCTLDRVPNDALIKFGKAFIEKNKAGYSPECKKLLLSVIRETRVPYRNSSHIYEGIEYYINLSNYFVGKKDSDAAAISYSALAGIYNQIGLFAKTEYYLLKYQSFLNGNSANDTLYQLLGTSGKSNSYLNLGTIFLDENKPKSAEKYTRLSINEFKKLRSPLLYQDAPTVFLLMGSIKTQLKSDSSSYYYNKAFELLHLYHAVPLQYAWYYIEKGKSFLSKNEDDSASYYFTKARFLKSQQNLGIASIFGELIPNYYIATLALQQNKPQEAIQLLQPEIQALREVTANISLIKELELLAKAYAAAGMYKEGFATQTDLLEIKEKMAREVDNAKSLNFAIEKKMQDNENNIALLKTQDEAAKKTKYYLYGILGLLGLFSVTLGVAILNKQRSNVRLTTINTEVIYTLEQLKQTQSQLIQSEKMASLGELTAGIAHEIQNPLNFVNNFSDVNKELLQELKEEADKGNIEDVKAIADDVIGNEEKINHHGKRADAIVKGMLQHSRKSSGQKELTDINALADEYLRLSYHGLRAKDKSFNAEIKTDLDESIGKINIIPQDIGRVLLNLFNNAFYAVNEQKTLNPVSYNPAIFVKTEKCDDKIYISVKDNGNGIPQKILDKIFQPFFTTKPTGEGTGLGLSLSYDIIKAHGGEIKVESKEGEGTEFIVQLPVVRITDYMV